MCSQNCGVVKEEGREERKSRLRKVRREADGTRTRAVNGKMGGVGKQFRRGLGSGIKAGTSQEKTRRGPKTGKQNAYRAEKGSVPTKKKRR